MQKFTNFMVILTGAVVLMYLYKCMLNKQARKREKEDYKSIQQILAEQRDDLAQSKKPILWIHIPYEYNARNWQSFGSRGTFDLNQPYLYLTMQSIINKCSESFQICIIDDQSFEKLIPDWSVNMKIISHPISTKMRALGIAKLIYLYGGMVVPLSFLCMRDLKPIYDEGIQGGKMFAVENIDRNATSSHFDFYPDIHFMGAKKESPAVGSLIEFMQRTISNDFTDQSTFLGDFDRWAQKRIKKGVINVIPGIKVGVKNKEGEPVVLEDLMGASTLDMPHDIYGIWVPHKEILSRRKFEWFARMSIEQIIEANVILSKYILMASVVDEDGALITELRETPNWVSFWSVPSQAPVWGLKPDYLGNNMLQLKEPSYAGN